MKNITLILLIILCKNTPAQQEVIIIESLFDSIRHHNEDRKLESAREYIDLDRFLFSKDQSKFLKRNNINWGIVDDYLFADTLSGKRCYILPKDRKIFFERHQMYVDLRNLTDAESRDLIGRYTDSPVKISDGIYFVTY